MVIGTYDKCETGEIIEGTYRLTQHEDIILRCMIIRESTYEEWQEYRDSVNRPLEFIGPRGNYYLVSTD